MNQISNPHETIPSKAEYDEKQEYDEKYDDIKDSVGMSEDYEAERPLVEVVRLVVPITDDTTLVAITFRFWVISTFFGIIGAVIQEYRYFRITNGVFSIFFVNLESYALGTAMARILPTKAISIGKFSLSLNPGPFNIKEHVLIGIMVQLLHMRSVSALGSLLLILSTQCVGYGMAGMLRKYLVYPAEMVWWSNLIQVVFYNAIHNTNEFKARRMIRGWSYMKILWVFCIGMFIYGFLPQYFAPLLLTNAFGTQTYGKPLTLHLFFQNGTKFDVKTVLKSDNPLNVDNFASLAACISHVVCFHGALILSNWKRAVSGEGNDIYTRMKRIYPEVPQLWYAAFYIAVAALAIFVCETHIKQLPWWGLLIALAMGWVLTLLICTMMAITGSGPGLNIITELVCGYILPGKPIANMAFKVYGYMTMYQCQILLSDLTLGHYMKIPPRSMFIGQLWGTLIGALFNYLTMILIIDSQRDILNGSKNDPAKLWNNQRIETFRGSGLIFGALGPSRMFTSSGNYGFVYYGFLVGAIISVILWALSKAHPRIYWSNVNFCVIIQGMTAYPNGYTFSILSGLIACLVFRFYMFRYHQGWWQKYALILASALDTGTAFTSVVLFLFVSGGISSKLHFDAPHWWGNNEHETPAPLMAIDRCGSYMNKNWTGGV
ncbi:hypothetical protein BG015_001015 [Linnemannia schmuckeri]|uniref:Oligopeptide transporter n=1 Tax=Linnemannia schmuckeri TaxID=64567 RepID=A0A9P5RSE5_9FUNG|nr:hypothetical protein BG015_001015 [Linnemannia schmuckeri]